jgi:hypothetical protein
MPRSMSLGGLRLASPPWAGECLDADDLLPGGAKIDATAFSIYAADVVVTTTAIGNIGDRSLTVAALSAALPAGATLNFGIPGLFAVLDAAAAAAAVTVSVVALVRIIPSGSIATFKGQPKKTIVSGTLVSRTIAQRDAQAPFHPAIAAEPELFIVAFDISDADALDDVELVMPWFIVKENFLPSYETLRPAGVDGALMTALRARYILVRGAE